MRKMWLTSTSLLKLHFSGGCGTGSSISREEEERAKLGFLPRALRAFSQSCWWKWPRPLEEGLPLLWSGLSLFRDMTSHRKP